MTMTNATAALAVHTNGTNGAGPQAPAGLVRSADIVGEMQVAYLDYAMSVIVARALPDVRDGLKPVHRRILYAMYGDLGLTFDKPHKKSARIVGEVLGKYHPHGDVAVYDAMARMAQDFSLRYLLVDGQGNFGSVDGDSPAAMRYTEARLAEISNLMLDDIEKETVAWKDNFDNSLLEPTVLPAALPNLLINGSNGIAVGMSTNIPPHNLGEIVDALAYMIDHYAQVDELSVEQLMRFIQGPDFPTGGIVYRLREDTKSEEDVDAIAQGYSMGKSRLVMQAKAHFEEMSRGRSRIVVTELPYQTNKAALIERIADLVRDGKIEGISDLRDESDRTGMRVIVELSRNVEAKDVLAQLFRYTPLQQTFGMQLLALVDGQPRVLSLKRMLHLFIQHRETMVRRRSEFDLKRARERAHIVEGLLKALDILDDVIRTIRNSQRVDTARTNLMKNFGFTEIQAQAILDMQLRRLAALERKKLQDEFKELKDRIAYLEDLLAHPEKILALIKAELLAIKEKYGDARRTQIVDRTKGALTTTDLLPDQEVWVSVGSKGEVRRREVGKLNTTTLRQIGKGSDVAILSANTRETLFLFSKAGRSTRVAVHEIPPDGKHIAEFSQFTRQDDLAAALTLQRPAADNLQGFLFLVTQQGVVKRINQADFLAAGGGAPTVMAVDGKDRLGWVFPTQGGQEVILVTSSGQAIRFNEDDVRSMGLPASGVGGIKLKAGDKVVYAGVVDTAGELITLTAKGFAKRTALADYPVQGRNGGGIVTHKLMDRTGALCAALVIDPAVTVEPLIMVTRKGEPKLVAMADIPNMGRSVLGKPVAGTTPNDPIVAIQQIPFPAHSPSREQEGRRPPEADSPASGLDPVTMRPRVAQTRPPATKPGKLEANGKPVTATVKTNHGTTRTSAAKTDKAASKGSKARNRETAATHDIKADKVAPKGSKARTSKVGATPVTEADKTSPKVSKPRSAEVTATTVTAPKAASGVAPSGKPPAGRGEQESISAKIGQRTATTKRTRGQPAASQPVGGSKTAASVISAPSNRAKPAVETKMKARPAAKIGESQARAPASNRKKIAKPDEAPVQSALFAVDSPAANEPAPGKKASKVQAVVSVPAAQASQSKRKNKR
jgi:DNA gyrase subunit A